MNIFSSFPFVGFKDPSNTHDKVEQTKVANVELTSSSPPSKSNIRRRKSKKSHLIVTNGADENYEGGAPSPHSPQVSYTQGILDSMNPEPHPSEPVHAPISNNGNLNAPQNIEIQPTQETPNEKNTQKKKKKKKNKKKEASSQNAAPQLNNVSDSSSITTPSYVKLLFNEKMIFLNKNDPEVNLYKTLIENISSTFNNLNCICNSSNDHILESQKSWIQQVQDYKNSISKLNEVISQKILHYNDTPDISHQMDLDNSSIEISINYSESYNSTDLEPSQESSFRGKEFTYISKASRGNKKAARQFMNNASEELAKLEKIHSKILEKAREEDVKDRLCKKYNTLRAKAGLEEVNKDSIITKYHSPPPEFSNIKLKMGEISSKLSKFFMVDVTPQPTQEKSNRSLTLVVSGIPSDVEDCIKYIDELNSSGQDTLKLDFSQIGFIIGRGGTMIRQLEQDFKVMVYISDETITLYSKPENIDEFKAHIQQSLSKQRPPTFYKGFDLPPLSYWSFVKLFSSEVRKLSEETKAIIKMIENEKGGRISVKAKTEGELTNVIDKLKKLQNQIIIRPLSKNLDAIAKFKLLPEYQTLIKNKMINNYQGELFIFGIEPYFSKEAEEIDSIFFKLESSPAIVNISKAQWNLYKKSKNPNSKKDVIILSEPTSEDTLKIEYYGNDQSKNDASSSLQTFIDTNATIDKINITESEYKFLFNQKKQLKQLELSEAVSIELSPTKKEWITIMGPPDKVSQSKEMIHKLINQGSMVITSVAIQPFEIPILKGPEGTTIKHIQSESNVKSIFIDDRNLVVKLKGSENSIKIAKELIESTLSNAAKKSTGTDENNNDESQKPEITPLAEKIPEKQSNVNFNYDVENFPSLTESLKKSTI